METRAYRGQAHRTRRGGVRTSSLFNQVCDDGTLIHVLVLSRAARCDNMNGFGEARRQLTAETARRQSAAATTGTSAIRVRTDIFGSEFTIE